MPYKSDRQRRFLHAKKPQMAKRWDREEKAAKRKAHEEALRRRLKR